MSCHRPRLFSLPVVGFSELPNSYPVELIEQWIGDAEALSVPGTTIESPYYVGHIFGVAISMETIIGHPIASGKCKMKCVEVTDQPYLTPSWPDVPFDAFELSPNSLQADQFNAINDALGAAAGSSTGGVILDAPVVGGRRGSQGNRIMTFRITLVSGCQECPDLTSNTATQVIIGHPDGGEGEGTSWDSGN